MVEDELPIEILSAEKRQELFDYAVQLRLSKIISDLEELDEIEREIRVTRDTQTFQSVFEESHHFKLSRHERLSMLNQPIGSNEQDKYMQVKYIYNSIS